LFESNCSKDDLSTPDPGCVLRETLRAAVVEELSLTSVMYPASKRIFIMCIFVASNLRNLWLRSISERVLNTETGCYACWNETPFENTYY